MNIGSEYVSHQEDGRGVPGVETGVWSDLSERQGVECQHATDFPNISLYGHNPYATAMRLHTSSAWQSIAVLLLLGGAAQASLGDRLPDFKHCLEVSTLTQEQLVLILT